MKADDTINLRPARPADARDLAELIDIAGEGIPSWLWRYACEGDQTPLDIGEMRARRETGGFSYKNAVVAVQDSRIAGLLLGYPIRNAPDDDAETLPAPIVPFVELEAQSVGSWYVNALAVRPGRRGAGIGSRLIEKAEALAAEAGCPDCTIQVYAQNSGAVRLYHRLGYVEDAQSPVRSHPCQPYYTGSVLLLRKQLG